MTSTSRHSGNDAFIIHTMSNLLSNPAIQSGVIPLILAITLGFLLKQRSWIQPTLSFGIAFYLSVYLATGLQLFPLTSTRKILIIGFLAIIIGILLDTGKLKLKNTYSFILALGMVASLWEIWPVLVRQEGIYIFGMLILALGYVAWLSASVHNQRKRVEQSAMMALALGLGTGISAILGASALIGQLAMAIGAIAGAWLLLCLFKQNVVSGSTFILPMGLLSGLLGVSAVIYASLPWYCLIPLLAVPLTAYIQLPDNLTKLKLLLLLAAFTLPFPVIAIALTWISTSSSESLY